MHGYLDLKVFKNTVVDGLILQNLPNHIFGTNSKKILKCVDVTINHDQRLSLTRADFATFKLWNILSISIIDNFFYVLYIDPEGFVIIRM